MTIGENPGAVETERTVGPPAEHAAQSSAETQIKQAGLHQMAAASDDASDYIAERNAQEAEDRGRDFTPTERNARAERYRRALHSAREHVTEIRNGGAAPKSDAAAKLVDAGGGLEGDDRGETVQQIEQRVRERTAVETAFSLRSRQFLQENPQARDDLATLEYFEPAAHVTDIIMRSELGPAIAHELSKIPEAVFELNELPPHEAARILHIVEGRLLAERQYSQQQPSNPRRMQTKAPGPLSIPRGGASPGRSVNDLAKSDDLSAYVKARNAEDAAGRRK